MLLEQQAYYTINNKKIDTISNKTFKGLLPWLKTVDHEATRRREPIVSIEFRSPLGPSKTTLYRTRISTKKLQRALHLTMPKPSTMQIDTGEGGTERMPAAAVDGVSKPETSGMANLRDSNNDPSVIQETTLGNPDETFEDCDGSNEGSVPTINGEDELDESFIESVEDDDVPMTQVNEAPDDAIKHADMQAGKQFSPVYLSTTNADRTFDDNPFAEAIAHNKAKRKHKQHLLSKLKEYHATTITDSPRLEDTPIDNNEFDSQLILNINGMELDQVTESTPQESDKGARERFQKKVTIAAPTTNTFKEVKPKGKRSKTVPDQQRPMVGIRVHKIGGSDIKQEKLTDLAKLLELIEGLDATAILLPHNKEETKAVKLAEMHLLQASKLKEFFDYTAEPWGAAAELRFRITVSFYLQTDVISPTLKELFRHSLIKEHTTNTGWRLSAHTLLESADRKIGFFMGKSVEHTWRDGMWSRLTDHLLAHGLDVPISIRENRIKATEGNAHVVSVFAGSKDVAVIEKCLQQNPFTECELLLRRYKTTNPDEWHKSLEVHKELSKSTRAVKVVHADDSFLTNLRGAMENDKSVRCKYVDIARKGFQDHRDILYVQCHQNHKAALTSWIKNYISSLPHQSGDTPGPRVDDIYTSQSDKRTQSSRQSDSQTINTTPLTKFHYMHGDDTFKAMHSEAESKGRSKRSIGRRSKGSSSIPTHVDLDVSSWADVVKRRSSKNAIALPQSDNQSQQSHGSDRSTLPSIKSQREQELEVIVNKLSQENKDLKQAQESTLQSQQALVKANKELLQQVQLMQTQLATVKEDIRKEFDSKFDTILDLFRGNPYTDQQLHLSTTSRSKSQSDSGKSPARKKPDNKNSPTVDVPMGANRQIMENMHMRNWLMYRYNGAPPYTPTIPPTGYPYMMPPVHMNLPQARVDHEENGG